MTLDHSFTSKN